MEVIVITEVAAAERAKAESAQAVPTSMSVSICSWFSNRHAFQ